MNTRALKPIESAKNLIYGQEERFETLTKEHDTKTVAFKKEANFALQALQNNEFLLKMAMSKPDALQNAILNIAATGLSLNPVDKQAYLIPRGGTVCLDVSYIGMVNLATKSESIKWVKAEVVYENDTFSHGLDQKPNHVFDPFSKDRGEVIGAYCVAKTADGDYLTEVMSLEEIHLIAERSQSFKKNSGPWKTDKNEMIKKTVIKRAAKLWPKVNAVLNNAIGIVNEHEGIDFDQPRGAGPATESQSQKITRIVKDMGREELKFLEYLSGTFKRSIFGVDELTEDEANQTIKQLELMNGGAKGIEG